MRKKSPPLNSNEWNEGPLSSKEFLWGDQQQQLEEMEKGLSKRETEGGRGREERGEEAALVSDVIYAATEERLVRAAFILYY